jgi:hypothetical protein
MDAPGHDLSNLVLEAPNTFHSKGLVILTHGLMLGTLHVELRDDLDLEYETSWSVPFATTNPCGRRLKSMDGPPNALLQPGLVYGTLLSSSAAVQEHDSLMPLLKSIRQK